MCFEYLGQVQEVDTGERIGNVHQIYETEGQGAVCMYAQHSY